MNGIDLLSTLRILVHYWFTVHLEDIGTLLVYCPLGGYWYIIGFSVHLEDIGLISTSMMFVANMDA